MRHTRKLVATVGALALVAVPIGASAAQGPGASASRAVAVQQGQRGQSGQRGQQAQRGAAGQMGNRLTQQMTEQQRQMIRADQQQSSGVRNCSGAATGIQTRARELARRAGSGAGFNATQARGEATDIGNQVQTMLRQHQQLKDGLNGQQQYWLRDQVRDIDRTRDRIRDRLNDMNAAIGAGRPDPARIAECSNELAQEMERWQAQYRQMGTDMGVDWDKEEKK